VPVLQEGSEHAEPVLPGLAVGSLPVVPMQPEVPGEYAAVVPFPVRPGVYVAVVPFPVRPGVYVAVVSISPLLPVISMPLQSLSLAIPIAVGPVVYLPLDSIRSVVPVVSVVSWWGVESIPPLVWLDSALQGSLVEAYSHCRDYFYPWVIG
jgi:hypothetical protein